MTYLLEEGSTWLKAAAKSKGLVFVRARPRYS
jgi:hypothetical protein